MMGIEGIENAVVTMEPHKLSPRPLNDTNDSITSSSEPPSPTLSTTTAESTPAVAALRELPAARMNEQKHAPVKEPIIAVKGGCVPCQSKPKPKPKQGTYLQPSQFCFKELSISLRTGAPVVQVSTNQPRRAQRTPTQPQASTPKTDNEDVITTTSRVAKPSKSRTAPQAHTRGLGQGHSSRVDALLRKYLGDQSQGTDEACTSETTSHSDTTHTLGERESLDIGLPNHTRSATPLNMAGAAARKAGLKPIMQVKSEQDAAIKSLKHTPRTFHAKPVPLEVAERRLKSTAAPSKRKKAVAAAGDDAEAKDTFTARPVPPSTTELRYAMLVADAQLRRFSSGKSEGELQPARGESGASIAAGEASATPLKRPSSARSRSRDQDAESIGNGLAVLPPVIEEDGLEENQGL